MTRHSTTVRLHHMLDYAREAHEMACRRRREDLDNDRQLNLSLMRLLEIVGEAAAKIPLMEREMYAGIPWLEIVGLRNRLIHGYDQVNFDLLWEIVRDDLPPLIAELQKILEGDDLRNNRPE